MDFQDLINQIPNILIYVLSGFICIRVFNFVSIKTSSSEYKNILIGSFVVGFAFVTFYRFIMKMLSYFKWFKDAFKFASENDNPANILVILLLSVATAFIFGKIYYSNIFSYVLKQLNVNHTVNKYIWADIVKSCGGIWVTVAMPEENAVFIGALEITEIDQRQPIIVLSQYTRFGLKDNALKEDYTNDQNKKILIDTSKAFSIELQYDKKPIKGIAKNSKYKKKTSQK